jgi:MoaA/NifB/PqqE/SkfB family radical SAM enzyme
MDAPSKGEMSFGDFKKVIRFLKHSRYNQVRLEGGEATIHPHFTQFADYALQCGFSIYLFTNGLFSKQIQNFIKKNSSSFGISWNVNEPSFYTENNWQTLLSNIRELRTVHSFALGVNVYRVDQDLSYMYDLCKEFSPAYLRYVFAHHVGEERGQQTIPQKDLSRKTQDLAELIRRVAVSLGIPSVFDCGFIPCIWTDQQLAILMKYATRIGRCPPCPGVDHRLRVTHCFHIDSGKSLGDFGSVGEIYDYLVEYKKKYDGLFLYKKCRGCVQRRISVCDMGCLGDRKHANRLKVL